LHARRQEGASQYEEGAKGVLRMKLVGAGSIANNATATANIITISIVIVSIFSSGCVVVGGGRRRSSV
jgi:hypothetical protein